MGPYETRRATRPTDKESVFVVEAQLGILGDLLVFGWQAHVQHGTRHALHRHPVMRRPQTCESAHAHTRKQPTPISGCTKATVHFRHGRFAPPPPSSPSPCPAVTASADLRIHHLGAPDARHLLAGAPHQVCRVGLNCMVASDLPVRKMVQQPDNDTKHTTHADPLPGNIKSQSPRCCPERTFANRCAGI